MSTVSFAVSRMIEASATKVYPILADYKNHHPKILPKAYFTGLEVEEGGQGAGTIFRSGLKVMGKEQSFRMRVSEPEPGRVLAETDLDTGLLTTFTVSSDELGHSIVTIATTFEPKPGLQGWLERLAPMYLRHVYRVELQQLNDYLLNIQTHEEII